MKQKRLLATFVLGLCALTTLQAQENEFDLGSQRSEVQLVNPVPGKKIDHHGPINSWVIAKAFRTNFGYLNKLNA